MDSIETLFYQLFHYSYVFLNSVPFDDVFKETIRRHTDLIVDFGKQEPDEWEFPQDITNSSIVNDVASKMSILNDTINYKKVKVSSMVILKHIIKMRRFFSGKSYKNKLVSKI